MNEKTNPFLQLDAVLDFLATNPSSEGGIALEDLQKFLWEKKDSLFKGVELIKVLDKLIKDGKVDSQDRSARISLSTLSVIDMKFYSITFDGEVFNKQGGYQQDYFNKDSENHRLRLLEVRQANMSKRLFWINFAIAIGTSVAGVYYLIEVLKYFHWVQR